MIYDTIATMAVLSPIAHTLSHYSTVSDLQLNLESDQIIQLTLQPTGGGGAFWPRPSDY